MCTLVRGEAPRRNAATSVWHRPAGRGRRPSPARRLRLHSVHAATMDLNNAGRAYGSWLAFPPANAGHPIPTLPQHAPNTRIPHVPPRPPDTIAPDSTRQPAARSDDPSALDELTWGDYESVVAVPAGRWVCSPTIGTPLPPFCAPFQAGERLARISIVPFGKAPCASERWKRGQGKSESC